MSTENRNYQESIDDRDVRALTEHITIVPTYDGTGDVEGVSQSGRTCRINTDTLEGDCPDAQYNCPNGRCKHTRRYEFASGIREIPEWVDEDAITHPFGEHIDKSASNSADPDASREVATDGGVAARSPSSPSSRSRSGVRDGYIVIGIDVEGAHHIYRTVDEHVLVVEDGEVAQNYDLESLGKDINDWIDYVEDKRDGFETQHLYKDLTGAIGGSIR